MAGERGKVRNRDAQMRHPGWLLCTGKKQEQIELLELDKSGIHVAEYLTVLPPPEVLRRKLHEAIETARARIESKGGEA